MSYAKHLMINFIFLLILSSTIGSNTLAQPTCLNTNQQLIHKDKAPKTNVPLSTATDKNHTDSSKPTSCHLQSHHPNYFFHDFTPTPIKPFIYKPFLTHLGIKLNWLGLIRQAFDQTYQNYQSGLDIQLRNAIQLSLDMGYENYYPKPVPDYIKCPSKGYYSIIALSYLISSTPIVNIYTGGGYGQSRYTVLYHSTTQPIQKTYTTHFLKIIFGSEIVLIPTTNLYGGSLFGLAYQLFHNTNNQPYYIIPGFGTVKSPINLTLTLYLKWNISFLEKNLIS